MPVSQTQVGTAAARCRASGLGATSGSARETAASTATKAVSAPPGYPLNEGGLGLAVRPLGRDEQLAVRALEAPVALGGAGKQLARERLLAVRTDDLALVAGGLVHPSESTYGRELRYEPGSSRSGTGGSLRGDPRWTAPRTRSPAGIPSASRPARVRTTRGVRQ